MLTRSVTKAATRFVVEANCSSSRSPLHRQRLRHSSLWGTGHDQSAGPCGSGSAPKNGDCAEFRGEVSCPRGTRKMKPTSLSRAVLSAVLGAPGVQPPAFPWARAALELLLLLSHFSRKKELNKKFPGFLGLLIPS